jgi:hypothetical protein
MTDTTQPVTGRASQNDPSGIAKKGKAALTDTQEVPAADVSGPAPAFDDFDDDEDEELSRRFDAKTRRKARLITVSLALVATLGIGFASGLIYQKNEGSSSTSGGSGFNASALRAALGGGSSSGGSGGRTSGFPFGRGGFGGGSSTSVIGTVSATDNGTLYISQGSSSALVKVVTNSTSTVTVPKSTSVSSIQPGDTVVISGAKLKDGNFMASSITDNGSSTSSSPSTSSGAGG